MSEITSIEDIIASIKEYRRLHGRVQNEGDYLLRDISKACERMIDKGRQRDD